LTVNTKSQRFFKTSPTSDRMSQKAWFLISPSPGHDRGIYITVGPDSLFPVDTSPCPLLPATLAQRYPHRQYSVSALERDEIRDFSLPTRYKSDLRSYGDFTQCRSVVSYRRFGTKNRSILQGSSSWHCLSDEDGIDTFSCNAGNKCMLGKIPEKRRYRLIMARLKLRSL
jgi:hypothetical protein